MVRGKTDQHQNQSNKAMAGFDMSRASVKDKDLFKPFNVRATRPLKQFMARGDVAGDTPVLLMEGEAGSLVLLTHQMTYHHVAQGELAGRPWMVSF